MHGEVGGLCREICLGDGGVGREFRVGWVENIEGPEEVGVLGVRVVRGIEIAGRLVAAVAGRLTAELDEVTGNK